MVKFFTETTPRLTFNGFGKIFKWFSKSLFLTKTAFIQLKIQ